MMPDDLLRPNARGDDDRTCVLIEGMLAREGIDSDSPADGVSRQRIGGELGLFARMIGFANPFVQHALLDLSPPDSPTSLVLAPDLAILRATTPDSWTSVPHAVPWLAVEVVSQSLTLAGMASKAQVFEPEFCFMGKYYETWANI
jgi:hypothetical protein